MILIYLFWFQMALWLLYWLLFKEYPFARKLKALTRSGYLEEHIQKAVDVQQLKNVSFHIASEYQFTFNPDKKRVTYFQESHSEYTLDELFSTIHELVHAKQLQEKNKIYLIRCFWSKYIRSSFVAVFVMALLIECINLFTWNLPYLWLLPTVLLVVHYLYSGIVLWNEYDANKRAYQYLTTHYELTPAEQKLLRKSTVENHVDYVLNIPVLLVVG